jgi:hypothetical protein
VETYAQSNIDILAGDIIIGIAASSSSIKTSSLVSRDHYVQAKLAFKYV